MSVYDLWRMAESPGVYTLGRMEDAERHQLCVIAERGWVDKNGDGLGDKNESRIPAGEYWCHRAMHHGKYECWELEDVPGREAIHIHIGNDPQKDSLGCPLVGTDFGAKGTVSESKKAYARWMEATESYERIKVRVHDIGEHP